MSQVEAFNTLCPRCLFGRKHGNDIHCRHPKGHGLYIQWYEFTHPSHCKYFAGKQLSLLDNTNSTHTQEEKS